MTNRSDIRTKLIYTCNCGWIDKRHAFAKSKTPFVGANQLWTQFPIHICRKDAVIPEGSHINSYVDGIKYPKEVIQSISDDGLMRFPDGNTGFYVRYKQHMGNRFYQTGLEGHYLVRHNLTKEQYKSIALSIFMEISLKFEGLQASFPWRIITDSGLVKRI